MRSGYVRLALLVKPRPVTRVGSAARERSAHRHAAASESFMPTPRGTRIRSQTTPFRGCCQCAPGAALTATFDVSVPSSFSTGTFGFTACVNTFHTVTESNYTNNCAATVWMTIY
jgi:hypothetical protein